MKLIERQEDEEEEEEEEEEEFLHDELYQSYWDWEEAANKNK
ncbi:MAG TPA: hypothetical protein VNR38_15335 [Ureibacillus sp.]|nr:hypothetical protein [Ureibacillus sp.]